jgi:pimeloyl-ACP methyl ester carboxylesterase
MSTWILLRGLTRETRHWHDFPRRLSQALPGARVIALELPGNGEFNTRTSPSTIEGMAAHCRSELVRLGVPPPYHLLAMSMGAMVATAWARAHPEEVRGCVLINTSFGSFSPVSHRLRPRAAMTLLRFLATRSHRRKELLIFELTTRLTAPSRVLDDWVQIRQTRPVGLGNALRQLIAALRFHPPAFPPVPTLILAGSGDRLVDPRCSIEIAEHWHCAHATHPAAGHDLPLDDGDWVAQQVREWMKPSGTDEHHT